MNVSAVKSAQWDKTQSRELLGLFICVCIALCTIVAHNIAQNRPDNFPCYPLDNHHCSDDVYLREGGDYWLALAVKVSTKFEVDTTIRCLVIVNPTASVTETCCLNSMLLQQFLPVTIRSMLNPWRVYFTAGHSAANRALEAVSVLYDFAKRWQIFSERELTFTFAICYRPSVCLSVCLSSVVCRLSVVCL